ncbi:hypothetical protein HY745_00685 [Candidatus Desantisbacteria bacterium]|nr:hypothetical protein [Candidatus Desantisbacteria bacterium]
MSYEILNLDKLNIKVRNTVETFCQKLLNKSSLLIDSIILYGSATGSDFIEGKSNINILLIVKDTNLLLFQPVLNLFENYAKKGLVPPLFFTSEEIKNSTDIFPIEFLDIKENHILLFGKDTFINLDIPISNLRLQCESELKGKIIRLRQIYLERGQKSKEIEKIIGSTFSSFIPIFKNLIRLKNKIPPQDKESIINIVCNEFGLEKDILISILRDRKGDGKIEGKDAASFLGKYLSLLTKLADMADKL